MDKKELFKKFASKNSHFVSLVNEGKTTWQKLYETYDIYGENSDIWDTLRIQKKTKSEGIKNILENIKSIDIDKLEENVSSLEKAFGFLSEILVNREEKKEEKKKTFPKNNKIERFFDD